MSLPTPTVNPIQNSNLWHSFTLKGVASPGFVLKGKKGFDRRTGWDEKKGKGTAGATLTLTSQPPAKGSFTLQLFTPEHFAAWDEFVLRVLSVDPELQKTSGLSIYYPALSSIGVTTVVVSHYTAPEHQGKGMYHVGNPLDRVDPSASGQRHVHPERNGAGQLDRSDDSPADRSTRQSASRSDQGPHAGGAIVVSYFATCAGLQVVGGSLMVPLVGAWTADLSLAAEQAVSGQVEVVIGNLTLQGTVYRSDVYGGQVHARVVGGAGGWRTQAPPQGYGSASGLMLSTVLRDLAAAVGEQINIVADTNIGTAFARVNFASSVASDVLWQFIRLDLIPAWYIDPAGVTQTGAWPELQVSTPFTPTDQKPDEGVIEIATEDYASWLPGCVFSHPILATTYTSAGVLYSWGADGKFRFQVLTKTGAGDRVLGPLQQLVQKETQELRFFGRYEYTISNPQPTTIDCAPVDTKLGLPELQVVPLVGDAIASYTPPDGGKAHVMFLDGSPTKPVCVWTEVGTQNGPTAVTLAPQGDGANNVARVTDTVVVLFPPLLQIAGIVSGAPFIGVLTITTPAVGAIQTGSSLVQATQS